MRAVVRVIELGNERAMRAERPGELVPVVAGAKPVPLTSCGQVVQGRAVLQGDLDCSAHLGHARERAVDRNAVKIEQHPRREILRGADRYEVEKFNLVPSREVES